MPCHPCAGTRTVACRSGSTVAAALCKQVGPPCRSPPCRTRCSAACWPAPCRTRGSAACWPAPCRTNLNRCLDACRLAGSLGILVGVVGCREPFWLVHPLLMHPLLVPLLVAKGSCHATHYTCNDTLTSRNTLAPLPPLRHGPRPLTASLRTRPGDVWAPPRHRTAPPVACRWSQAGVECSRHGPQGESLHRSKLLLVACWEGSRGLGRKRAEPCHRRAHESNRKVYRARRPSWKLVHDTPDPHDSPG
jgi:hypothetical protein